MSRIFFREELETVATFWRIFHPDGTTLGFTSHDRDLYFGGVRHQAAPGMVPSAVRRTTSLSSDSIDVEGALSHDAIKAADLAAGRYDGATFEIGVVDWNTLEAVGLYRGVAGDIVVEDGGFSAELRSAKANLLADIVPRTSPTCRATFCGPGCNLNPARFTHEVACDLLDPERGLVRIGEMLAGADLEGGHLRWVDGPHAGLTMAIAGAVDGVLELDQPLSPQLAVGTRAIIREGCDHTLATCHERFGNAAHFQGEPFLPGNDMLTRYAGPES